MYSVQIASELVWYVLEEYRRNTRAAITLFNAFEYWANTVVKADKIQVSNLYDMLEVEKFYDKKKYRPMEICWIKDTK